MRQPDSNPGPYVVVFTRVAFHSSSANVARGAVAQPAAVGTRVILTPYQPQLLTSTLSAVFFSKPGAQAKNTVLKLDHFGRIS